MERYVRENFWIPSVRSRVKKEIRRCTTCIRWRGATQQQRMADVPRIRFGPAAMFSRVGVDLVGPYLLRASKIKFDPRIKVWICVFVCLTTQAVHLELVTAQCRELS